MPRPPSKGKSEPAREAALRILLRVDQQGSWASRLLESLDPETLDPRDLALVHEIVLGVLRWRGRLDAEIEVHSKRPLDSLQPVVLQALRLGAYQILFLDRVPAHSAVDGSVELVRRAAGPGPAGFVNAVLRRVAERAAVRTPEEPQVPDRRLAAPQRGVSRTQGPVPRRGEGKGSGTISSSRLGTLPLARELSHPEWMVARTLARWGFDETREWLLANNHPAPVVIRPNPHHAAARGDLAAVLAEEGIHTEPGRWAPGALRVVEGSAVRTRLFREGAFWIQDEASQLVPLLFPPPWEGATADLCAAPGGKAFVLATGSARAGDPPSESGGADRDARFHPLRHRIAAFDLHPHRLVRMREGMVRLGLEDRIGLAVCDLASAPAARPRAFDRVLVDAPCSGTGVLRRHPEIRWRLRPEQIDDLSRLQGRLLDRAAELVRPGGHLVYSVCSVEPEEGEGVLVAFLERSGGRIVDPRAHLPAAAGAALGPDGVLRTRPHVHGTDGFFAALVRMDRE